MRNSRAEARLGFRETHDRMHNLGTVAAKGGGFGVPVCGFLFWVPRRSQVSAMFVCPEVRIVLKFRRLYIKALEPS